jgi:hypothetical protein
MYIYEHQGLLVIQGVIPRMYTKNISQRYVTWNSLKRGTAGNYYYAWQNRNASDKLNTMQDLILQYMYPESQETVRLKRIFCKGKTWFLLVAIDENFYLKTISCAWLKNIPQAERMFCLNKIEHIYSPTFPLRGWRNASADLRIDFFGKNYFKVLEDFLNFAGVQHSYLENFSVWHTDICWAE